MPVCKLRFYLLSAILPPLLYKPVDGLYFTPCSNFYSTYLLSAILHILVAPLPLVTFARNSPGLTFSPSSFLPFQVTLLEPLGALIFLTSRPLTVNIITSSPLLSVPANVRGFPLEMLCGFGYALISAPLVENVPSADKPSFSEKSLLLTR